MYTRIWDVADYVIPPAENGAFFVATNVIITANQTRGKAKNAYARQNILFGSHNKIR